MEGLNAIIISLIQMMYIVETNMHEFYKLDKKVFMILSMKSDYERIYKKGIFFFFQALIFCMHSRGKFL